jgi:HD-GYP domain-containing protein (c-di-GMP phosphodiesterase class II)
MGYRTRSALTIPMKNHENDIIGVLQLINKQGDTPDKVIPFTGQDQHLAESLASQAAVALTNKRLLDDQKELFESFVKLIATAIDEKSPFTGNHCRRVPELTMMLAEAAHQTTDGPLQDFCLNDEDRYELEVAGWLHDCGKVTTPEHIIDKATKLETIYDRVGLVDTRFEVLKRDVEIRRLRQIVNLQKSGKMNDGVQATLDEQYLVELGQIDDDRDFIRQANIGNEFMSAEDKDRVQRIAQRAWVDPDGDLIPFLSEDEVHNLCIEKGTLNPGERDLINHHITMTIRMLEALPFPKHLARVPEYAGGHHERMDGKGYPKGLTREQLSIPARTMAIADIFEALTAKDRPYKEPKKLSEALMILGRMKDDNHIDPDLYEVFVSKKVYLDYAKQFLMPFQIDIEDTDEIPGYQCRKAS